MVEFADGVPYIPSGNQEQTPTQLRCMTVHPFALNTSMTAARSFCEALPVLEFVMNNPLNAEETCPYFVQNGFIIPCF
jgi:hypothetical protein